MKRVVVSLSAVVVLAAGLVFSSSVSDHFSAVLPVVGPNDVAEGQAQQVCVWYTEAPHVELARRNRVNGSCPTPPVVPHSTATTACANGGAWKHTGNDGTGWWYVSVCGPPAATGLTCSASSSRITLRWGDVTEASRYRVSKD